MDARKKPLPSIIGLRFGHYVVRAYIGKVGRFHKWECRCDCGSVRQLRNEHLLRKNNPVTSCGCGGNRGFGNGRTDASPLDFRIKQVLYGMRNRCYNKKSPSYGRYGARGITICQEWMDSPDAFVAWAKGKGWSPEWTIERIDNDGPYSPDNCCLSTHKEQIRNRRNTVMLSIGGIRRPLCDWAESVSLKYYVVYHRAIKLRLPEHMLLAKTPSECPDDPRYTVYRKPCPVSIAASVT